MTQRKRITFEEAADLARRQVQELTDRAQHPDAMAQAMRWAHKTLRADTHTGTTYEGRSVSGQFVAYDWAADYLAQPSSIFHDFFRPLLLNKYQRIVNGYDAKE